MSADGWTHVVMAGVDLEVPPGMVPLPGQGIDGTAAVLEGGGLRLVLDRSLFADPLTGHRAKPAFAEWREEIGGVARTLVSYGADESAQVLATRLPGLTATIHVPRGVDPDVALRILRSIRPVS